MTIKDITLKPINPRSLMLSSSNYSSSVSGLMLSKLQCKSISESYHHKISMKRSWTTSSTKSKTQPSSLKWSYSIFTSTLISWVSDKWMISLTLSWRFFIERSIRWIQCWVLSTPSKLPCWYTEFHGRLLRRESTLWSRNVHCLMATLRNRFKNTSSNSNTLVNCQSLWVSLFSIWLKEKIH